MMDSSNLYLDLSNKMPFMNNQEYQSDHHNYGSKSFNYPHTTEKTGHHTRAVTNTVSNQKKDNTSKKFKTDCEQEFTAHMVKSFSTRKLNLYSDFDEQSDKKSGITEVRHSITNSNAKMNNIKPSVIKGFWSSISSNQTNQEENGSPEKQIIFKHDFYMSGDAFYPQNETSRKSLKDPDK